MSEAPLITELASSLRRSRLLALLPLMAGGAAAAVWIWVERHIGFAPLLLLALGAAGSVALAWLLGLALNQHFLPQLAQLRGFTAAPHTPSPHRLLPDEVVPMGTRQLMHNMVKGTVADRPWQAGFLECSRRDLQTGSTKTEFQGQVIQVHGQGFLSDFVLRPAKPGLSYQKRLSVLDLPEAAELTSQGTDWLLYTEDQQDASDLARRCRTLLDTLPAPPKPAQLLGIVSANGWLQLICASPRDLFSVWNGPFSFRSARTAIRQLFEALNWCEVVALALAGFEQLPDATQQD